MLRERTAQELAIPRQRMLDWTRRREAQEEFIEIVRHCQSKDLLRVAFRAWTFNLDTIRAVKKAKDERAAVFFSQMLHQRARDMLKKWLAVSLGNSSRKVRTAPSPSPELISLPLAAADQQVGSSR